MSGWDGCKAGRCCPCLPIPNKHQFSLQTRQLPGCHHRPVRERNAGLPWRGNERRGEVRGPEVHSLYLRLTSHLLGRRSQPHFQVGSLRPQAKGCMGTTLPARAQPVPALRLSHAPPREQQRLRVLRDLEESRGVPRTPKEYQGWLPGVPRGTQSLKMNFRPRKQAE